MLFCQQEGGPPEYIFFSASRTLFSADIDEDMGGASARVPSCIETETWIIGSFDGSLEAWKTLKILQRFTETTETVRAHTKLVPEVLEAVVKT